MQDFLQLSFSELHQFQFLRPNWLFALLPLAWLLILKTRLQQKSQWSQIIPPHLAQVLLSGSETKTAKWPWLVTAIWLLSTIALAGPVWQKIEKPVFEIKRASVILMDMSLSMRATDLKPNRLSKSKYKAIDLANAITDGEMALVVYAGDAFTISPLTPDAKNLTALIPSLQPEIMPEAGSNPILGLEKSAELLKQAGYMQGDIFWFTDGIDQEDIDFLSEFMADTPYRVSILGFGTLAGAPIKQADGSLLKDNTGSIVIPKLVNRRLAPLAGLTGGLYQDATVNDNDIKRFVNLSMISREQTENTDEEEDKQSGDDWHEFGPYLVLLVLPFVLCVFRRGTVIAVVFSLFSLTSPNKAYADNASVPNAYAQNAKDPHQLVTKKGTPSVMPEIKPTTWTDTIFKTRNQKASQDYTQGNFAQAQQDFKDPNWKASAAYKAGDYATAAELFDQDKSANGFYNKGNALAKSGDLENAQKAYDEALKLDPNMEQAKANKNLVEQLLKQQEQQQQENGEGEDQDGEQNSENSDQQDGDQENEEQDGQQDGDQSEGGQEGSQSNDAQQDGDQQNSESEQSEGEGSENQGEESEQNGEEQQAGQAEESDKEGEESEQQSFQPLTAEQVADQEQQQKIQQLLRKVNDDPSVLLRNKMRLEKQKRQQLNRYPKGATKSW